MVSHPVGQPAEQSGDSCEWLGKKGHNDQDGKREKMRRRARKTISESDTYVRLLGRVVWPGHPRGGGTLEAREKEKRVQLGTASDILSQASTIRLIRHIFFSTSHQFLVCKSGKKVMFHHPVSICWRHVCGWPLYIY